MNQSDSIIPLKSDLQNLGVKTYMDKLVSIVLPVYNGEKYLAKSIESVLSQTYKNLELIIVNDSSTDSSEEIIMKFKELDERIVYIKNDINSKLPQSLNNGFSIAKGDYYSWTSDDNMYHKDAIEKMVHYMENHNNTGLVCSDMNIIDENGDFQYVFKVGTYERILTGNNVGACFLYRADVAKAVGGYRNDLLYIEDYEYWLRIYFHSQIDYLNEILYEYRHHSKSLTESKKNNVQNALERFLWNNLYKYEKMDIPKDEIFELFTRLMYYKKNKFEIMCCVTKFSLKHITYITYCLKKIHSICLHNIKYKKENY